MQMTREDILKKNEQSDIQSTLLDIDQLQGEEILLKLTSTCTADPERQWVPGYSFDICNLQGARIGHCSLRVGYNEKVYIGGNIGYGIDEPYRGHHYAGKTCFLLFDLARKHGMDHMTISCMPENIASARTIEYAGGIYVETAKIPEDNEMYAEGKRWAKIYYFDF